MIPSSDVSYNIINVYFNTCEYLFTSLILGSAFCARYHIIKTKRPHKAYNFWWSLKVLALVRAFSVFYKVVGGSSFVVPSLVSRETSRHPFYSK